MRKLDLEVLKPRVNGNSRSQGVQKARNKKGAKRYHFNDRKVLWQDWS